MTPDGKGKVFFKSDETHVRSMALDRDGQSDRAAPSRAAWCCGSRRRGEGFVFYQMPKREVTAIAIGPKNEIFAAAVGSKTPVAPPAPAATPVLPLSSHPAGAPSATAITITPQAAAVAAAPVTPLAPLTIPGGSDVYRIAAGQP